MKSLNGIFIDDAGTPGVESQSKFLHESRKSWCGIVIPSEISDDVAHAMTIFTEGIKSSYGADELHFTDIQGGRRIWKDVKLEERIEIFDLMGQVMEKFQLPVFYQTWSEEFRDDHKLAFRKNNYSKIGFWNLRRIDHFGLILLMRQIQEGIEELRGVSPAFRETFQVFVDEGISSAGANVKTPLPNTDIFKDKICFEKSKNSLGIQIADFCAFVVSRSQWIWANKKAGLDFKRGDTHLLAINAKLNHWSPHMQVVTGDEKLLSREGVEFLMKRDRQQKGLPPETE